MPKIHTSIISVLLCLSFTMSLISGPPLCFAEELSGGQISNGSMGSAGADSNDIVVDFSKGTAGFQVDNIWKIQDNELQLVPNETTPSRFYWNLFPRHYVTDYQISVNVRWINGSCYSAYGLFFGERTGNFYAFLITLNNRVLLLKSVNGRWKTIKTAKNNTTGETHDNLKVICRGPLVQCFVNEAKMFETKDKSLIDGCSIGVCSDGNVQSGFSEFRLKKF